MLKRFFAKVFAFIIVRKIENTYSKSFKIQEKILFSLLKKASHTQFGIDHNFNKIDNYEFFKKNVPVRDYEEFSTYISKIKKGSRNILWPGKPLYFAKTSGTTSGLKYIKNHNKTLIISTYTKTLQNQLWLSSVFLLFFRCESVL